jgi:hypothetical protein
LRNEADQSMNASLSGFRDADFAAGVRVSRGAQRAGASPELPSFRAGAVPHAVRAGGFW